MRSNYNVNLFDLLMALSTAVDLVSPALSGHHKRVAHIAFGIGSELGWKPEALNDLVVAGALHDIGAFSLQQRTDTLQFDMEAPYRHAEAGYLFLRRFDLFSQTASVVRHHHARWDDGAGAVAFGEKVPEASHLLHLADRVDILIDRQRNVLGQAADITRRIEDNAGRMFLPPFVDAFGHLASREYFWLDAVSPHVDRILAKQVKLAAVELGMDEMENLAVLFSRIIDFKSSFTSTHTSGVAATAEALSGLAGFSQAERQQMRIAGYFHDLGKLAVPAEILEKPAKLTDQ